MEDRKKTNQASWDQDISFLTEFKQVIFHHMHRENNKEADFCASLATLSSCFWKDNQDMNVPSTFLPLLKDDSDSYDL